MRRHAPGSLPRAVSVNVQQPRWAHKEQGLARGSARMQVAAFPTLYDRNGGCELPEQGFALHNPPRPEPAVTLNIAGADGPAFNFVPGERYELTSPAYLAFDTLAWVHASAGATLLSNLAAE